MTPAANSSVLIPSFRRPETLLRCLDALAAQQSPPGEILVIWQGDDTETRDAAESRLDRFPTLLRVLHSPTRGVVPAENVALDASRGEVILLIDDDAIAPVDWVARHLAHYTDPTVGAVGGPAINIHQGVPYPTRAIEPVGRVHWTGRFLGNMYDQVPEWRSRPPREVDHLVGYNMSLRRSAFDRFEDALRPYWQLFEGEACFQVKSRGFRVLFDFANVVEHYPSNTAYDGTRGGDLQIKIYNGAFNHAFLMAKHTGTPLRLARFLYLMAVGNVSSPGLLASLLATRRFGDPGREWRILRRSWLAKVEGWRAGSQARWATR